MGRIVRYFFILVALFSSLPVNSQNYVKTETCLDESETSSIEEYSYFDGLGRKSVSASNGIASNGKYVYTMQTYDTNGREYEKWLPAVGTTTAACPSPSDYQAMSSSTYEQEGYPYSSQLYNALDLVTTVESAGSAWRSNNKNVLKRYGTNTSSSIKYYIAGLDESSLQDIGYYPANSLTVEETLNEDNRKTQVYKDFLDRTVLERSITGDSIYDTYYVYDARNQLRFVLTPEFQSAGWKDKYAYEYRYDNHGRLVKKLRPHCAEEQFYYDSQGRIVYTQESNGGHQFFFYDNLGRQVIKGWCNNFNYHHYEDVTMLTTGDGLLGSGYQYSLPNALSHGIIGEATYYDNYTFLNKSIVTSSPNASLLTRQDNVNTAGLKTGSIVRTSSNKYLISVFYYDEQGRVIDKRETLLNGGFRKTVTDYSFTDKPLTETCTLTVNGTTTIVTTYYEYYTSNNQLKKLSIAFNSATPVTVAEYEYNDLGMLSKVKRGGNAGNTDYTYNLRGWPTSILGKGFNEWLYYTDGLGTPCYSGNVSSLQWQTDNETFKRGYKYHYDGMGRLTKAEYAEGDNMNQHLNRYTEWVKEYTFSNAIRKIERYGKKNGSSYGKIDNLRMYYNGLQIVKVKEDADPLTYTGAFDFVSSIIREEPANNQYSYSEDGALKWDSAKGVALMVYNRFNSPRTIQFTNGNRTEYEYSATGEKLRTVYLTAVPNISVPIGSTATLNTSNTLSVDSINYVGNFVFENGQLSKYLFAGGYATIANGQPTWHYYVQDHLGNNRVVINHSGNLEQANHYYPFGAIYGDAAYLDNTQRYKYNGKELDRMHGLNYYDYSARQYDPLLCRFTQMDPKAEEYFGINPYAYCANDPVNAIDPDGRDYWYTNDKEQIYAFLNAWGRGQTQYDFSGWGHATDAEFCGNLTYNDETHKFYTSYTSVVDGELTVVGKCFNAYLTPVSFSGIGYPGAFVYEAITSLWDKIILSLDGGLKYNDGYFNWNVNYLGRITGYAPIIGIVDINTTAQKSKAIAKLLSKGAKQCKEFGTTHGEKIFKLGNKYYSFDNTQHNGGVYKVFKREGGNLKRTGTADENLNIFKR